MARRIFGVIIFLWCGAGVIGGGQELMSDEGVKFGTGLGALIFCGCLALLGLHMAISTPKPPENSGDQPPPSATE
jgi:hypothetical protein